MAFGFTPKYAQDIPLEGMDKERFLIIAIETAIRLKWGINFVSETGFITHTPFALFSEVEKITLKIDSETAHFKSESTRPLFFDLNKNKRNIESFLKNFEEVKETATEEWMDKKRLEIRELYPPKTEDILNQPPPTVKDKINNFFSIFIPVKGYFVTPILLDINIFIFILMVVSGANLFTPDIQTLLNWGANYRHLTMEGEWWRLLTNCFLHIGIIHLLMNMYALIYIGMILEPYLGKTRFAAAYLLTGIAASVSSLYWSNSTISAGASGAIFGMYGVFLALLTTKLLGKSTQKTFLVSILIFVFYNLMYGLKPNSGIDNAAHIGGLLSGLFIGYALIPSLKKSESKSLLYLTIGVLSIILLVFSSMILKNTTDDFGEYQKGMDRLGELETKALELYDDNNPSHSGDEVRVKVKQGITCWNEAIGLLDSLNMLNLPDEIIDHNEQLKRYCELRLKVYNLIDTSLEIENYKTDQIQEYTNQLNLLMDSLNSEKQ